ncbi:Beta-galactosidase C-terminal domain [Streptomyces sp. NBC_00285]|uniref:Beta-galactosidase C-terminal domain n=1 Tax=Streptomyces sp. NBC_00285 TaxID=2975700 RepID=UPI002E2962AE|nr:Beta-galactosidase C-terminal domain [Streptomyces sp. NBC_00285]
MPAHHDGVCAALAVPVAPGGAPRDRRRPPFPGLPEHVQATVRAGDGGRFAFLLNHGQEEVEVGLPAPMTDALARQAAPTDRITLPGAGVAVLIEP